jgi:hypothetical protein
VLDRSMSTVRAMLVVVVSVMWFVAGAHMEAPWWKRSRQLGGAKRTTSRQERLGGT